MRIGGKVAIKSSNSSNSLMEIQETGILVDYDRISATCKVLLDNNPSNNIVQCDSKKLIILDEVTFIS